MGGGGRLAARIVLRGCGDERRKAFWLRAGRTIGGIFAARISSILEKIVMGSATPIFFPLLFAFNDRLIVPISLSKLNYFAWGRLDGFDFCFD